MLRNAGLSGAAGFAGFVIIDIATFSALICVSYTAFCGALRDMVPHYLDALLAPPDRTIGDQTPPMAGGFF